MVLDLVYLATFGSNASIGDTFGQINVPIWELWSCYTFVDQEIYHCNPVTDEDKVDVSEMNGIFLHFMMQMINIYVLTVAPMYDI